MSLSLNSFCLRLIIVPNSRASIKSISLFRFLNLVLPSLLRDFVYVKDVVNVCYFLMHLRKKPGIYNLGSGKARTFLDLANNTFKALDKEPNIEFIDTPADIRDKYQYFTEANMNKLVSIGYLKPFHTLEEGINDYVKNYLIPNKYM